MISALLALSIWGALQLSEVYALAENGINDKPYEPPKVEQAVTYEPTYESPAKQPEKRFNEPNGKGKLTKGGGVYRNPESGYTETWYSVYEYTGAPSIPGQRTRGDGVIVDKDGYVCVASSDLKRGTVVETSLGKGKVYDCGCSSGIIDVYTEWR